MRLGILHPGEMGISVAASAQNSGNHVHWASVGRSTETVERARAHGLINDESIAALCAGCEVIVSVCPPASAIDVANEVALCKFSGLYVDANAVSPMRARAIGAIVSAHGARFVDGGIIGPPAWKPGETTLYLSGAHATEAAALFIGAALAARVIDGDIGSASALKMVYASFTKGSTALLAAMHAVAEQLGVRAALNEHLESERAGSILEAEKRVRSVTAKAWRFTAEMHEIADTYLQAGLPGGFHEAAAQVYEKLAQFKGAASLPEMAGVLAALINTGVE